MQRLKNLRNGGNEPPDSSEPWCRPSVIEVGSTRFSALVVHSKRPRLLKSLPRFALEVAVGVVLLTLLVGAAAELGAIVLHTVVAELNRYNHRQLVIVDSSMASLRIGGIFETTSPDNFTKGLALSSKGAVSCAFKLG